MQRFKGLYLHTAPSHSVQNDSRSPGNILDHSLSSSILKIHERVKFLDVIPMSVDEHVTKLSQRLSKPKPIMKRKYAWMASLTENYPYENRHDEFMPKCRIEAELCREYEDQEVTQLSKSEDSSSQSTAHMSPSSDLTKDQEPPPEENSQQTETGKNDEIVIKDTIGLAGHVCNLLPASIVFSMEPYLEDKDPAVQLFGLNCLHSIAQIGIFFPNSLLNSLLIMRMESKEAPVTNALQELLSKYLETHPHVECERMRQYATEKPRPFINRSRARNQPGNQQTITSAADITLLDIFISSLSGSNVGFSSTTKMLREFVLGNNWNDKYALQEELIATLYKAHGKDKFFGLLKRILDEYRTLHRVEQNELVETFCQLLPPMQNLEEEVITLTKHTISRFSQEQRALFSVDVNYWASTSLGSKDVLKQIIGLVRL